MKKICAKCGIEKDVGEFYKDSSTKDGLHIQCKACVKAYQEANRKKIAAYREANKEKTALYGKSRYEKNKPAMARKAKAYREKNKLAIYGNKKAYREKNKIEIAAHKKDYNQKNKTAIARKTKAYREANKEKIAAQKKVCREAHASFSIYAPQLDFAETCSEGLDGELLIPCTYCGKVFAPTTQAVQHRIKAINGTQRGESRCYCSAACKLACPSYKKRTKWASQKPATSREVSYQFRQLVLERDNWTCQRCGAGTEAELHCHHIEGAVQQPGMANDLESGVTLCKACHKEAHSEKGCRYVDLRCPTK